MSFVVKTENALQPKWTLNIVERKNIHGKRKCDKFELFNSNNRKATNKKRTTSIKKLEKNPITNFFYSKTHLHCVYSCRFHSHKSMWCDSKRCNVYLDMNCCFALLLFRIKQKFALSSIHPFIHFNWKLFHPFKTITSNFQHNKKIVSISRSQNDCVDIVSIVRELCVTETISFRSVLLLI